MKTNPFVPAILITGLMLGSAGPAVAVAAPFACLASAGVAPTVRSEGLTELVGDLVIACTGGTPTAPMAAVPQANITLFLNTAVTSRVLSGPWSEALLLVDEPTPAAQLACQTADGVCPILGTGTGVGTYDGSAGRPNVFQGQQTAANSISWLGVPIDQPGDNNTRVFRLTNIRVDASALAVGPTPTPVIGVVTVTGSTSLPISNPLQTLAFVQQGLAFSVRDAAGTAALAGAISLPRCASAANLRVATLRFSKLFATAFRKRNIATSFASPTATGDQNFPGLIYNTETGFFNAALVGNAARGVLATAGLADFGTRLKAVFEDVPAGLALFVDVNGTGTGGSLQTARLTASETDGFSAVSETPGGPPGAAAVSLVNGTGSAVWEVTDADPLTFEGLEFGVYVSYTGNGPAPGAATVDMSVAPTSPVSTASSGPVPRFADLPTGVSLFGVAPCGVVTGAGAGGGPHVRVFDSFGAPTAGVLGSFFAYAPGFTGGVRVAAGDVNGDGIPDLITGAGPGGGPHVQVFDGLTGAKLPGAVGSFFAFDPSFAGGVFVAAGDVNGDGFADVIIGADAGGGPHVRVLSGLDGSALFDAFAYDPTFTGGVRVAAGDVDGDGRADIITGAGPGGPPHVRVLSGANGSVLREFFAFPAGFTGGVYVAAADIDGDGRADIITGAGAGGGPHVRVLSGLDGSTLFNAFVYHPAFTGGVQVGGGDVDGDGRADLVTGAGPGGGPHVRVFSGAAALAEILTFFAYDPLFGGGVFVGAR